MLPNQMSRYSMDTMGTERTGGSVFAPMQGPMPVGRPGSEMIRRGPMPMPGPALSGGRPNVNMGGDAGPIAGGGMPQQARPLQAAGPALPSAPQRPPMAGFGGAGGRGEGSRTFMAMM
jgi:hypothetical protein